MTEKDFLDKCEMNAVLVEKGAHKGTQGFFVCVPWLADEKGEPPQSHISDDGVAKGEWAALWRGMRQGLDVEGRTRIVGYLSRTKNWNLSKIGELKDRQRGRYSVEPTPPSPAECSA